MTHGVFMFEGPLLVICRCAVLIQVHTIPNEARYRYQHGENPEASLLVDRSALYKPDDPAHLSRPVMEWLGRIHEREAR